MTGMDKAQQHVAGGRSGPNAGPGALDPTPAPTECLLAVTTQRWEDEAVATRDKTRGLLRILSLAPAGRAVDCVCEMGFPASPVAVASMHFPWQPPLILVAAGRCLVTYFLEEHRALRKAATTSFSDDISKLEVCRVVVCWGGVGLFERGASMGAAARALVRRRSLFKTPGCMHGHGAPGNACSRRGTHAPVHLP